MSDLTDEAVKALLDGATPGPWRADGEPWNRVVWSPNGNRVCFMAHSSGLDDARDTATSNLVAAAPDLARALLDARAEHAASLIRINAEAVEAVAQARADAQAAVADIVRSIWGRCEALEDEAADKLAQLEKLTDHEKGFWRGQKTVAKSIRRSTEMPTAEAIAIRRAEGGKA